MLERTDERYWQKRTIAVIGEEKTAGLTQANVLVVGLGGVGGIAAEMLARAGIGRITVVDGDTFDLTNRNRQIGAFVSTMGRPKTEVMKERMLDINPKLEITALNMFLGGEETEKLLDSQPWDCVLDAIDPVREKCDLIAGCVKRNIPLVSSMGSAARLNPELVRTCDISKTEYCPLARAVRRNLRDRGIVKGVTVVFSPENAVNAMPGVMGSMPYMPAIFGCHCAAAVINRITG